MLRLKLIHVRNRANVSHFVDNISMFFCFFIEWKSIIQISKFAPGDQIDNKSALV